MEKNESSEAVNDPNYAAFLRDQEILLKEHFGDIVAYADGNLIAAAKDARELVNSLPDEFRHRSLLISEVPQQKIKFRRPMRVIS